MKRKNNKNGFILIITIVFLSTTTFSLWFYLNKANLDTYRSEFLLRKAKSSHLAESAFNLALTEIRQNKNLHLPSVNELYETRNDYLSYHISSEDAKLNINNLVSSDGVINKTTEAVFLRLIENNSIPFSHQDIVYDWIDADDISRKRGAEQKYYKNLGYMPANRKLISLDELKLIKNNKLNNEQLLTAGNFISTVSGGKININYAEKEILMALHENMTEQTAKSIIKTRTERGGFLKIAQLKKIPGISDSLFNSIKPLISVENNYFLIYALGKHKNTKTQIKAVIEKSAGKIKIIRYREI